MNRRVSPGSAIERTACREIENLRPFASSAFQSSAIGSSAIRSSAIGSGRARQTTCRRRRALWTAVLAGAALLAGAVSASAQVARVSGLVRDESGQPIKGATIRAENPDAPLGSLTAATDDKGRFAIIGLARGEWMFFAEAPGFQQQYTELNIQRTGTPLPPLVFALPKAVVRPPAGVEGMTAKELQQQLASADALYRDQKFEEAVGIYRSILRGAPSLAIVNLQIGAAYRHLKEYDKAIAAYTDLLKAEPDNPKAHVGLALATLDKGDRQAAEQLLVRAAGGPGPDRDVFYNLGELTSAKNQTDEAAAWYRKAAAADTSWGKPLYRLGTLAMNKGDKNSAIQAMSQVLAVDPTSPEAAQARAAIEQLKN
jgi:Flp pilus assembly protein TadD